MLNFLKKKKKRTYLKNLDIRYYQITSEIDPNHPVFAVLLNVQSSLLLLPSSVSSGDVAFLNLLINVKPRIISNIVFIKPDNVALIKN